MENEKIILVKSFVKELVRSKEMMMSGDFLKAYSDKCVELLENAIERAKGNGRKTLKPIDL